MLVRASSESNLYPCLMRGTGTNMAYNVASGSVTPQGPASRKPWKLFGTVKLFFVHLCLKTDNCTRFKLLV